MKLPRHLGGDFVAERLDERLREEFVRALVELGNGGDCLERLLVGAFQAIQPRDDVLEPVFEKIDFVRDLAVTSLRLSNTHSVKAGRQRLDRLQHLDDLRVLLLRHLAGHEDAEVPDVLVQKSDDHLSARLDLLGRAVDVGHPVERLLRWRDVVAHRREEHNRRPDVAQVKGLSARALRARPQLVADEEIAGDPLDLFAVHEVEAAPPALELEEARWLGVDVRVQVVVLVPERVRRIQVLEVLDEVGAIEDAGTHVGGERGQPRAAQHAARVAHRVVARAFLESAAPIRHRRAVDDDRAGILRVGSRQHHRRPAALAVADDHGLRARRVQLAHLLHELLFGMAHVEQRLPRLGIAEEDHEVDRVSGAQRDADLRVVLEAADARAVAGTRIDDHVRPQLRIDFTPSGGTMRTSA